MRINRYIASSGLCSRRDAERLITAGEVRVNGTVITDLSTRIGASDRVEVSGKPIRLVLEKVVYAFHKPIGVTVSMHDPKQRNLLPEWIAEIPERVVPIGRLDKDSSGLLLLSNDGDLVQALTHPSFKKKKIYRATLDKIPSQEAIRKFSEGILLDGVLTKPAVAQLRGEVLTITLTEGRNRQIRRMWELLGYKVVKLHRIEMDGIRLGDLKEGKYRKLTKREVTGLK